MTHPFFISDTDGNLRPLASIQQVTTMLRPRRNRVTTIHGDSFDVDGSDLSDLCDRFVPNALPGLELVQFVCDVPADLWFAQSPIISWRVTCEAVRPVCAFTASPEGSWCIWERDPDRVFVDEVVWGAGGLAQWQAAVLDDHEQMQRKLAGG